MKLLDKIMKEFGYSPNKDLLDAIQGHREFSNNLQNSLSGYMNKCLEQEEELKQANIKFRMFQASHKVELDKLKAELNEIDRLKNDLYKAKGDIKLQEVEILERKNKYSLLFESLIGKIDVKNGRADLREFDKALEGVYGKPPWFHLEGVDFGKEVKFNKDGSVSKKRGRKPKKKTLKLNLKKGK